MSNFSLFLAGLSDSYNPCSIGVLLISLTILVTLNKRDKIALFGISYLTAIFATYFLIGLGMLKAFHIFGVHGFFGYAAGIILIVLALSQLFARYFNHLAIFRWLNSCHMPGNIRDHLDKGIFGAGVILGFLIGLCTIPCAGGIYLGATALLASSRTYLDGIGGLLFFNLGFILPLILIFYLSSREGVLEIIKRFSVQISRVSLIIIPLIMLAMGLVLIWVARL